MKRICRGYFCGRFTTNKRGYCDACQKKKWKEEAAPKRERTRFYDTKEWRAVRAVVLIRNPLCVECGKAAELVDHIKPISGADDPLALDLENLQSMCHACHNRKRGREAHGSKRFPTRVSSDRA